MKREIKFLILAVAIILASCSKEERYITPPDPNMVHKKEITEVSRSGNYVTFVVDMPAPYTVRYKWYYDYLNDPSRYKTTYESTITLKLTEDTEIRVKGYRYLETESGPSPDLWSILYPFKY